MGLRPDSLAVIDAMTPRKRTLLVSTIVALVAFLALLAGYLLVAPLDPLPSTRNTEPPYAALEPYTVGSPEAGSSESLPASEPSRPEDAQDSASPSGHPSTTMEVGTEPAAPQNPPEPDPSPEEPCDPPADSHDFWIHVNVFVDVEGTANASASG